MDWYEQDAWDICHIERKKRKPSQCKRVERATLNLCSIPIQVLICLHSMTKSGLLRRLEVDLDQGADENG